jgi:hypothetical protein
MPAETDFFKFGRRHQTFLIVGGRQFNASNSDDVDENYLDLCGTRLPLFPGRTLVDEEEAYLRRNRESLDDIEKKIEAEINTGRGIEDLNSELSISKDVHYFLREICAEYNYHVRLSSYQKKTQEHRTVDRKIPFMSETLKDDFLVMNMRLYPLVRSREPVFAKLNGQGYTIEKSRMKVEDVEKQFQDKIYSTSRAFIVASLEKTRNIESETAELKERSEILMNDLNVSRLPYALECGDLGFAKNLRGVYYLLAPHQNYTSEKSYGEGQSAVFMALTGGVLSGTAQFVERNDRNSQFTVHPHSNCYGTSCTGNTMEEKMLYLRVCKQVVESNNRFYQPESTTQNDYSY